MVKNNTIDEMRDTQRDEIVREMYGDGRAQPALAGTPSAGKRATASETSRPGWRCGSISVASVECSVRTHSTVG